MGIQSSVELRPFVLDYSLSFKNISRVVNRFHLISHNFGLDYDTMFRLVKLTHVQARQLFDLYNPMGLDHIDGFELLSGLIIISNASLKQKGDLLFELFDFDNSQSISLEELVILNKSANAALAYFTDTQPMPLNILEERTKALLHKIDYNDDGVISMQEFQSYVTRDFELIAELNHLGVISSEDSRQNWGDEENPGVDSDLEEEISQEKLKRSEVHEEVKQGKTENYTEVTRFPIRGTIARSVPTGFKLSPHQNLPPDANLTLEHIHGYRCHDTRNNIKVDSQGKLVYHTAGVGVVLNDDGTQSHFVSHIDDIISFDLNNGSDIAVTGEVGSKPMINVWNTQSMEIIHSFKGVLTKGIQLLAISNDNGKVAAVGADENATIALYDLNNARGKGVKSNLIISQPCGHDKYLCMEFHPSNPNRLVLCGVKIFKIITINENSITQQKGIGWGQTQFTQHQALTCIGFVGDKIYTGAFNGHLIEWDERQLNRSIQIHDEAIIAIAQSSQGGLITGGNDGYIYVLDASLAKTKSISLRQLNLMIPKVRSLCERGNQIICGTRSGEIISFEGDQTQFLVRGHFDKELWGLAGHPNQQSYATVGQDGLLAVWSLQNNQQISNTKIPHYSETLDISPDGEIIAVGCDNGMVLFYSFNTLELANQNHDRTKAVSVVRFGKQGSYFAAAGHDQEIYIYSVQGIDYTLHKKLRGHSAAVTHLDFSADNQVLQSNSLSYEILYHSVTTGKRNPNGATEYKDTNWETWTCILGWPVQGIWPPYSDGSDINIVATRPECIATGDDFGLVKLFRNPCIKKNAGFNAYKGHSSHVTNVKFIGDYLVSTGGHDKSIFVWKFENEPAEEFLEAPEIVEEKIQIVHKVKKPVSESQEKPWEKHEEIEFQPGPKHKNAPDYNLYLHRVSGYRGYDCRNNIKVTNDNKIVYHTAGIAVVEDVISKQQQYFSLHSDDIVSLAIHPLKEIIATGQVSHVGQSRELDIYIWSSKTMQPLKKLTGFHQRAVKYLEFSPNGSKLLSIGEDNDHSAYIHDWASNRQICMAKVDKDSVLGACFYKEEEVAIFGTKFTKFMTYQGQNANMRRGVFGKNSFEAQFCGVNFQNKLIAGGYSGNLLVWENRQLARVIQAHDCPIWAMSIVGDKLMTGGQKGNIHIWNSALEKTQNYQCSEVSHIPGIKAIDQLQSGEYVVGTRSCEIYLIQNDQFQLVQSGHYNGEAWGLAIHPQQYKVATSGDDKIIKIWDIESGNQLAQSEILEKSIRGIDWSPNGEYLVTGNATGLVQLFNSETLQEVSKLQSVFKTDKSWIQTLKFSPDGKYIALGAHGGASRLEILTYEEGNLAQHYSMDIGFSSALLCLDWAIDSSALMANSQAYEIKYIDIINRQIIPSTAAKSINYFSFTCILGSQVQYIWPEFSDGSDINSTCCSRNQKILATADDFGQVKIFNFPVVIKKQGYKAYNGHSSHVTRVLFTHDDEYLVSLGGNDKTVFIWKTDLNEEQEQQIAESQAYEVADVPTSRVKAPPKRLQLSKTNKLSREQISEELKNIKKPWVGSIRQPTWFKQIPHNQNHAPDNQLELEWVHGYRAKDCRNNIRFLNNENTIIYHAAGLGIITNIEQRSQQYFNQHTDDIIAFDISPDRSVCATAEIGRYPKIYVWSTNSGAVLSQFNKPIQRGVECLSFSPTGYRLVVVGMDNDHTLALYDLETNCLILSTKGDSQQILDVKFVNDNEFVTVGLKHYKHWTVQGSQARPRKGIFGNLNNILLSIYVIGERILTGSSDGHLIEWDKNNVVSANKIHERAIDSLWANQQFIVVGGKDSLISILNHDLTVSQTINLTQLQFTCLSHLVRSACLSDDCSKLLIGTYGSDIIRLDLSTNDVEVITQGHYTPSRGSTVTNEVWGLDFMDNNHYYTSSDDGTVRKWDIQAKRCIGLHNFSASEQVDDSCKPRSISTSPNGQFIAFGFKDGSVKVLLQNWDIKHQFKHRNEEIGAIKFSPDGSKLAVGSHDNFIDIYETENYKKISTCKGHSSYITHLDWSQDSRYLHTTCGAYEILFWEAKSGKQLTNGASDLRDERWETWTLTLGWPVQGVYPPYSDGTDVNATDRSNATFGNNEYQIIATADDFSMVNLFRYPCLNKNAGKVQGKGHSSHVTNVKFSPDSQRLVSTGGDDQCVFQWIVRQSLYQLKMAQDLPAWDLPSRYQIVRSLGQGTYGQVCLAQDLQTQETVAIKSISGMFDDITDGKRLLREIAILHTIRHPNVIGIKNIIIPRMEQESFNTAFIVMESCATDLRNISCSATYLDHEQIKFLMYQAVCGLRYIHSANILHRDLKPANLLINSDCTLKICDFGLSRSYRRLNQDYLRDAEVAYSSPIQKRELTGHVVTRWYRAPEVILMEKEYDTSLDVWSLGCVYAEMLNLLQENVPNFTNRAPLFPGRSCFPLSPDLSSSVTRAGYPSSDFDQINLIFQEIGTPIEEDIQFLTDPKALQYIRAFPPRPATSFSIRFPGSNQQELDLLQSMLVFNPKKRSPLHDIVNSQYFDSVRNQQRESLAVQAADFEWDTNSDITRDQLREMIRKQVLDMFSN